MQKARAINPALIGDLGIDAELVTLLDDQPSLDEAAARLATNDGHQAALSLLARHMARPYAVGWAAACVKACGVDDADRDAVACVDEWLSGQDDAVRRRAAEIAADQDYGSAGAWLAAAAGWSGGSLSPEGQPEVPPPGYLYAVASAGAVSMAIAADPAEFDSRYEDCVARALEILGS